MDNLPCFHINFTMLESSHLKFLILILSLSSETVILKILPDLFLLSSFSQN